jgi:hypothetical protein
MIDDAEAKGLITAGVCGVLQQRQLMLEVMVASSYEGRQHLNSNSQDSKNSHTSGTSSKHPATAATAAAVLHSEPCWGLSATATMGIASRQHQHHTPKTWSHHYCCYCLILFHMPSQAIPPPLCFVACFCPLSLQLVLSLRHALDVTTVVEPTSGNTGIRLARVAVVVNPSYSNHSCTPPALDILPVALEM